MSTSLSKLVSVTTPQILWHGGGNENGKADPVYSLDFHPTEPVLLTTGIDANVPPKGSVRLWKVDIDKEGEEFLIDLSDHQSVINIARFSPCGKMIASASEKQVVIYTVTSPNKWSEVTEMKQLERLWLRPTLNEVFDLEWSPDSTYIVIGALEGKSEIIRVTTRDSLLLLGHSSYVQGVTWDPANKFIVSQSADRSCKVHQLKHRPNAMIKLAPRGHVVMRMHTGYNCLSSGGAQKDKDAQQVLAGGSINPENPEEENGDNVNNKNSTPGVNLFADASVPSFFRRLSFTPDGALLIVPTGIHRNPLSATNKGKSSSSSTTPGGKSLNDRSFCTHVFSRQDFTVPCLSLTGLEEPSVAVRCCSRLFKLIGSEGEGEGQPVASLFRGSYRMLFAVVTIHTVFIYDTQHSHPIMKLSGLHYAAINDAAWSSDGRVLCVCSSDGYLSFVRFTDGVLGELLPDEEVPDVVKMSHPCVYNFVNPTPVVTTAIPAAVSTPTANAKLESENMVSGQASAELLEKKEDNDKTSSGEEFAKSTAESNDKTTIAPDRKAAATMSTLQVKKKKRIQPEVIGNLGTVIISKSSPIKVIAPTEKVTLIPTTATSSQQPELISLLDESNSQDRKRDAITAEIIDCTESNLAPKNDEKSITTATAPATETATASTSTSSDTLKSPSRETKKKRIAPMLIESPNISK